MSELTTISLGWGTQSWGLAAMSALGVLPKVDAAIHADTTYERTATYAFAKKWMPWLESHGVRVITVSDLEAANKIYTTDQTYIPAFTRTEHKVKHFISGDDGEPDEILEYIESGQLNRSCTQRWKITPVRRWISAELERRGLQKEPGIVEQWIGISLDEWERAKESDVKYISHRWPLIEQRMSRTDVEHWLLDNGLEVPPKSACIFCPYHDKATWREIAREENGDFAKAVEVDELIRCKRPGFQCYIHPSRKPLDEVDFRNAQDRGQLELWPEECSGMCFL